MPQDEWRPTPIVPAIFHIVHVDRLESIVHDGHLLCDATVTEKRRAGTTVGIEEIKRRRRRNPIASRPGLHVGDCVPFYFCPRSVMLYLLYQRNHPNLTYLGGQDPIVHLEADMIETATWADSRRLRWAFTLTNAGLTYFEDRCCREALGEIDWTAIEAQQWSEPAMKAGKQAEFLVETRVAWSLIRRIGVRTLETAQLAEVAIRDAVHQPPIEIRTEWYY